MPFTIYRMLRYFFLRKTSVFPYWKPIQPVKRKIKTNISANNAERDDFLGQAGIKVLRYKTRQNVTAETLRADVTAAMVDEKQLAKKGGK